MIDFTYRGDYINFFRLHAGYRGQGVLIEHVSLVRFIDAAHICGLPEVYILSLTDNEGAHTIYPFDPTTRSV